MARSNCLSGQDRDASNTTHANSLAASEHNDRIQYWVENELLADVHLIHDALRWWRDCRIGVDDHPF